MKKLLLAIAVTLAAPSAVADSYAPRRGEIVFNVGSSSMPSGANAVVGEAAGWYRENPGGTLVIDSFAAGSSEDTTALALKRAEKMRDQLVSLDVDLERIVIAAYPRHRSGKPIAVLGKLRMPPDDVAEARKGADTVLVGTTVRSGKRIATK